MTGFLQVHPVALVPTRAGSALFLGDGEKSIMFYIDTSVGDSINMVMLNDKPERPLSHDLIMMILQSFGAKVTKVTIVDYQDEVFFARIYLEAENEISQRKLVEIDARPSDCVALAVRQKCPIYIKQTVWETCPDMTETLNQLGHDKA